MSIILGVNGLEPGFKYNVRVRGIFNGSPGQWSPTEEIDVFSDTTAGTGDKLPSAVSSFIVTPTIDSFILTWNAPTTNADGSVLKDMKDYVIEVRNDSQVGTLDASYTLPEHQKPSDLTATDRAKTFEFTYKMNKELYGGAGQPVLYFKVYARDATNNRSAAAQATGTNASPSAPTSLTATATIGGANVTWGGGTSNDITGYILKYSTSNGFDPLVAGTIAYQGPNTNFSFSGTAGTTYYFRVGSVDTFGQVSYYASQASATPINPAIDSVAPAAVTSLADNWRGTSYILTWTAPADADVVRYRIDIRNDANSLTKTFHSSSPNFELTLQNNIDAFGSVQLDPFSVNVYAIDYSGNQSTAATLANPDAAPANPGAPTMGTPVVDPAGIFVPWTSPSDPNGIIDYFEINGTGASSTTVLWEGRANSFKYSLPSAFSGTYNFRGRTRDKFGRYSSYSSDASITATSVLSAPTASGAIAFDAADPRNETAAITVSSISPPSSSILQSIKLRYKKSTDSNWTEIDLAKTTTTYIIRGLIPGIAYNVEIASYDIVGRLSTWGTVTGSPLTQAADTTGPGTPTSVDLTAGATSINVEWTGVSDADTINNYGRYDIEIATDSGFTTGVLRQSHAAGAAGATGFASFGGLTPTTTYWARVRAVDYNGNNGSWAASTPTSIAVGSAGGSSDGNPPGSSPTPTLLSGIGGIHVRWTPVANNDPVTYEVHVSTSNGFTPTIGGATRAAEISGSYIFIKTDGAGAALSYATNYYVRLFAKDSDGNAAVGAQAGPVQMATVANADITDGTIQTAKLVDGAVTAAKLGASIGGGNMLSNGSMEADSNADNIPDSWTNVTSGTITTARTLTTSEKIYGAQSQRLQITAATTAGYFGQNQTITIPAGALTKVTASFWYKGSRTGTGGAELVLGNSALSSFQAISNLVPTSTWQRGSVTWTVPGADTTAKVEVRARAYAIADTIDLYVDGLQLEVGDVATSFAPKPDEILPGTVGTTEIAALAVTAAKIAANTITASQIAANTLTATEIAANAIGTSELSAGAVTANKLAVIVGGGNILANSGLEAWSAGLPVSWTKGANATLTQVTGRLGVGSAARHTATTAGNVGTNRLSQALTTKQTLAANTTYTLSAYVKRNSGTGDLAVAFDGLSTYTLAGAATTPAISTSWQRFYVTFTTGGTAPTPMGFYNTVANDIFEIDDVQLEVGDVATAWTPRTDEILPGTIVASMIATDTITANEIAADAITVSELAANAVTATEIAAGSIATTHINATGINADKINIGGNASNMVPTEYADFEATSTLYAAGQPFGLALVGAPTAVGTSATQAKFGVRSATLTLNLANQGIYLATSATTYNIPVTSGKTYIVSAYIFSSASQNVTISRKNTGGGPTGITMGVTAVTAGSWQRVYGSFTAGADAVDNISITFSGASGIQYIDGVMMEERIGTQNVPSSFVKPSTVIDGAQIITGSLNADRITAGTITTDRMTANSINGDRISAGTLDAAKIVALSITAAQIQSGTITATQIAASGITADKLQIGGSGVNLIPPQWSDFEFDPYYYVGKMDGANATALASTEQTFFGSQSCKVTTTVQPNNTVFLGVNNVDYNFRVVPSTTYIFSAYIYQNTGSNQTLSFRYKNQLAAQTDTALTSLLTGTTSISTGVWQRVYATITTGASDTSAVLGLRSFSAVGSYYIDGVMLEARIGNQSTPSPWAGSPQTVIDGNQITTGYMNANRISLGLFGSNQIENGAFEDTGVYPRVPQRTPSNLATAGSIPGWTTQRIGGDASSFHALEWGDWSTNGNLLINGSMNDTPATSGAGVACTFTIASDLVTANGHGLTDGTRIMFTSITSTTGIVTNTYYYVISATTNTFQVSAVPYGGAIDLLTLNGSGTYVVPTTAAGWSITGTHGATASIDSGANTTTPFESRRILAVANVGTSRVISLEDPVQMSTLDFVTVTDAGANYNVTNAAVVGIPVALNSSDIVTTTSQTAHGLVDGDIIRFTSIVTTTGITVGTNYYVVESGNPTPDSFQVSLTKGGAAINLVNTGTGAFVLVSRPYNKIAYTSTNIANAAETTLTPNGTVAFGRSQEIVTAGMASGSTAGIYQSLPITPTSVTPIIANMKYYIAARSNAEYRLRLYGQFTIVSASVTSNVVTINTRTPHGMTTGASVEIENLYRNDDPTSTDLSGVYTLTSGSGTTFTYAKTAINTSLWTVAASRATSVASMVQSGALTTLTTWTTSPSVTFTPNGNHDAVKVAAMVVATAASGSLSGFLAGITASDQGAVVPDPFTTTLVARSGQAKAVLNKADASTTRGTSLTSDPVAVSANNTYLLGLYYYGDMNQTLNVTFEYSATTDFSSPTVFTPSAGVLKLAESHVASDALNTIIPVDIANAGYMRVVMKNSGTSEKGTLYVEDVWLAIKGRTSGELTDAGIRLFDEDGRETVSLMADSSESGDFINLGKNMTLDGSTASLTAESGSFTEDVVVSGTSIKQYLTDSGTGVIVRGNRSSNVDFINAEVPHSNWAGGATVNSGIPFMELSVDGLDDTRDYRISVNGVRIYNTNANSTFADVALGYRYSEAGVPAMPRHDTALGLDDVILRSRFGKQANQNVTQQSFERVWNPPASGNYRFLLYGASDVLGPGGTIRFDSQASQPCQIVIEDLGVEVLSSGVNRGVTSPDTDTRKITKTVTFPPKWIGLFDQSGNLINQSYGPNPTFWEVGASGSGGFFAGNRIFVIYDQTMTTGLSDASAVPEGATINWVSMYTTIQGNYIDPYGVASTGNSFPYPSYAAVPGKSLQTDLRTRADTNPRYGLNELDLSNVGTKANWSSATASTRYKGMILTNFDSLVSHRIGDLRINFTVLE